MKAKWSFNLVVNFPSYPTIIIYITMKVVTLGTPCKFINKSHYPMWTGFTVTAKGNQ